MHPDEIAISPVLAARLIAAQFPQWERLPLTEVRSVGVDNRGTAHAVPRRLAQRAR
jgi:hypothetical protein